LRSLSLPLALSAALVAGALPRAAHADGAADAQRAKELFEHGRDLRSHGNCADALPLFQKAYSLYPTGLGSLRNVAICDETLGRMASARSAWRELRRALGANADPKYAGWTDDADHAAVRLAPQVATLTIDLSVVETAGGAGRPVGPADGIDVTVDGQAVAREQLGAPIEHDAGTVVVRAVGASGAAPDEATVALAAGESKHVALHVTIATATPTAVATSAATRAPGQVAEPATFSPDGPAPARPSPLRTSAWVALGIGAAGLTGALVSFSFRQSALAELATNCPNYAGGTCDPAKESMVSSDVNRGRTASTLINVFGAVGLAGSIAGVTLFALSRSPSSKTAVVLTPNGVAAAGAF
jgi:hypothetical protein